MAENSSTESTFGVFTTDTDLRIKVWDNALARFTGVPAEVARGKRLQDLFPEIETRGLLLHLQRALKEGTVEVLASAFHQYFIPCPPQTVSCRFERMLQRTTIAPVHEATEVVGVIVTIEDVTQRIEREREAEESLLGLDDPARLSATEETNESDEVQDQLPLVGALRDSDWRIRKTAVAGLTKRPAPDAIEALLDLLRQDYRNLSVLNSALQVLSMVDVDTFSPLVGFLNDSDPDLRMQAALALGEQRDQRAVKPLLAALNDPDTNVRYHAIESLGKLRATEAVDALTAVAESQDFFLGFPALDALKEIGDPTVAPRLAALLSVEPLQDAAIEALGELGDESTVLRLAQLLNTLNAPTVVVAEALARLDDRFEKLHGAGGYIADLSRQSINATGIQQLLDALNEVEQDSLRPLARVIGWLRGPTVDQALVRLLGEPTARSEVVEALVKHGQGVMDLLIEQLNSSDIDTRRASVVALGRLGHKRATMAIATVLKSDPTLKVDAANALAKLGDEKALDALLDLVGDDDALVRHAVVGALNSIGSAQMPERVEELLQHSQPLVRESAVRIAGYFGYPNCADLLIKCCKDVDERVRRAAVELLPFMDDPRVADELFRAVSEETPRVRAAAATALGSLDHDDSVAHLLGALHDEDSWVRYFAARSLGRRRESQSIQALREVLTNDKSDHVRISALSALGQIGGEEAMELIKLYVADENKDIARAAASALDAGLKG